MCTVYKRWECAQQMPPRIYSPCNVESWGSRQCCKISRTTYKSEEHIRVHWCCRCTRTRNNGSEETTPWLHLSRPGREKYLLPPVLCVWLHLPTASQVVATGWWWQPQETTVLCGWWTLLKEIFRCWVSLYNNPFAQSVSHVRVGEMWGYLTIGKIHSKFHRSLWNTFPMFYFQPLRRNAHPLRRNAQPKPPKHHQIITTHCHFYDIKQIQPVVQQQRVLWWRPVFLQWITIVGRGFTTKEATIWVQKAKH